jgi:hypothetical protein
MRRLGDGFSSCAGGPVNLAGCLSGRCWAKVQELCVPGEQLPRGVEDQLGYGTTMPRALIQYRMKNIATVKTK